MEEGEKWKGWKGQGVERGGRGRERKGWKGKGRGGEGGTFHFTLKILLDENKKKTSLIKIPYSFTTYFLGNIH